MLDICKNNSSTYTNMCHISSNEVLCNIQPCCLSCLMVTLRCQHRNITVCSEMCCFSIKEPHISEHNQSRVVFNDYNYILIFCYLLS